VIKKTITTGVHIHKTATAKFAYVHVMKCTVDYYAIIFLGGRYP